MYKWVVDLKNFILIESFSLFFSLRAVALFSSLSALFINSRLGYEDSDESSSSLAEVSWVPAPAPLRRNPNFFSANFEFFLFYSYFSLLVLSPKFSKQTRFKFRSKKKKENFYTSFWFGFSLNGVDLVPLRWDPFASLCFDAPCGFELKSVWVWYMVGSVMTSLMWVFWCWDVMSYCYTCLLVWLCRFMVNFWLWVCAFSGCFMNLFGPPSYDCWVCIL